MQTDLSRAGDSSAADWAGSERIDLKARFLQLWAGKLWIIGGGLGLGVLVGVIAFQMTPVYRATVLLAPASDERNGLGGILDSAIGRFGGLASLAGINVNGGDTQTQEALAVLRSRKFTEAFIRDNNLMPRLFASRWDAKAGKWTGSPDSWPTPGRAYKYFNDNIRTATEDKKTGLISLHIDWRNRPEAAAWANQLVRRVNAEMRERSIAKAGASIEYLKKELAGTEDVGTREAINRLVEMQIRQRMLANVTDEYAFRVIDPALEPELTDKIRPKKALMMLLGGFLGGLIASVFVLLFRKGGSR